MSCRFLITLLFPVFVFAQRNSNSELEENDQDLAMETILQFTERLNLFVVAILLCLE
jgi:hypothetical protein